MPSLFICKANFPIGKIAAHSAYEMFSWYKYLIVSLFFSHLGFWSGSLFLIAPFPDLCLLVLFSIAGDVRFIQALAEKLTELFHCMWRKEASPHEFKDASIIHLYKRKRNPQVCDNHRDISLLSIVGKILTKILLNRLNANFDQKGLIPESHCGFRTDRGAIDMIFTARQLQEKCQEQNVDLYMTFVDFTKAFDTVSHDGHWKIMAEFGYSQFSTEVWI